MTANRPRQRRDLAALGIRLSKQWIGWALAAALGVQASAALAQEETTRSYRPPPRGTSETYIVTLNANGVLQPSFPGSDNLSGSFFPSLSYRRSDEPERFTAPDDGISVSIIDTPTFRVGPLFRIQSGRFLADDRLLFGLEKRKFDVESGVFVEYWPLTFIRARAELRHGFRSDSGLAALFGVDYVQSVGRFTFSLGPRLYLGDKHYQDRYFGVRPLEAAINGHVTPFSPDGGLTAAGATASVTYKWNDEWSTTGYVNYRRIVGDAADSPIVRRIGSPDQYTVGAKVSYSFAFTPWW